MTFKGFMYKRYGVEDRALFSPGTLLFYTSHAIGPWPPLPQLLPKRALLTATKLPVHPLVFQLLLQLTSDLCPIRHTILRLLVVHNDSPFFSQG